MPVGITTTSVAQRRIHSERPHQKTLRNRPDQNVPSTARVAAGAFGFLIFNHALDGPELYGASLRWRSTHQFESFFDGKGVRGY
jgi:hypothetical protein